MPRHPRAVQQPVISKPLSEELEPYKGRWVAIDGDHVVASGDSIIDVVELARERSIRDPLTFLVPHHPRRAAFYRSRE